MRVWTSTFLSRFFLQFFHRLECQIGQWLENNSATCVCVCVCTVGGRLIFYFIYFPCFSSSGNFYQQWPTSANMACLGGHSTAVPAVSAVFLSSSVNRAIQWPANKTGWSGRRPLMRTRTAGETFSNEWTECKTVIVVLIFYSSLSLSRSLRIHSIVDRWFCCYCCLHRAGTHLKTMG